MPTPSRRRGLRAYRIFGFTLLEILLALGVVGVLLGIALPGYQSYKERLKIAEAVRDIGFISAKATQFALDNKSYPTTLTQIGWTKVDPWGNPYQYLSMEGATVGQKRKDRSLHPLNSDFDLYSMGPDGNSVAPLTAKASQDDIIRANDGAFIGKAADY